jgi:ABC-type phosphate/phosphonate transport system ATPase subunit
MHLLETHELVTGYGKKQVLSDVSVEVGQGEIVAVIGPNGSGKSTLLKRSSGGSLLNSTPLLEQVHGGAVTFLWLWARLPALERGIGVPVSVREVPNG